MKNNKLNIFSKEEQRIITSLKAPWKIQEFVNVIGYNTGKRISVFNVMREKKGDCLEAAMFACFVLQEHKIKTFLIDLTAVKDEDHVLCVFKVKGLYGAIAQSKFLGLRYRHPVYKTLRELAMSYFDNYFSFQGYMGLRGHSVPLPIKFTTENLSNPKFVKEIEARFSDIKHNQLVPKNIKLDLVSKEKFTREIIILPNYVKIPNRYK
ncbi:MAG: hypothetical protein WCF78_02810 [archaeon]